jgi:HKD family nuclease
MPTDKIKALLTEREVLDCFEKLIKSAETLFIAQALVTTSGLALIRKPLEKFLSGGGSIDIVIGFDLPTSPDAVDELLDYRERYPKHFRVLRYESKRFFHPKFVLFGGKRKQSAMLGSSNLTKGGFSVNEEANLFVSVAAIVKNLRSHFETWFTDTHAKPISKGWLADYRKLWKERSAIRNQEKVLQKKVHKIKVHTSEVPARIEGKRFCFTGGIPDYPRKKLYPLIEHLGGIVVKNADRLQGADCLVHAGMRDDRTTKKLRIARKLGVPIMKQDDFLVLLPKGRSG